MPGVFMPLQADLPDRSLLACLQSRFPA